MKPVALLDTVLETTPFAETVYDPFVGSGTAVAKLRTLLASDPSIHGSKKPELAI